MLTKHQNRHVAAEANATTLPRSQSTYDSPFRSSRKVTAPSTGRNRSLSPNSELLPMYIEGQRQGLDCEYFSQDHALSVYVGSDFSKTASHIPPSMAGHTAPPLTGEHQQWVATTSHLPTSGPSQFLDVPTDQICSGTTSPCVGVLWFEAQTTSATYGGSFTYTAVNTLPGQGHGLTETSNPAAWYGTAFRAH
jgi:hypothetical protein